MATEATIVLPDLPKKSLANPKNVLSILTGRVTEASEKKKKLQEEISLSVLDILKEVSATLPAKEAVTLDIDDMTLAQDHLRMSGKTNSFEAVDQIKTSIAKSTRFKNVTTDNVRKGIGDQIRFDLSMDLKDLKGSEGTGGT